MPRTRRAPSRPSEQAAYPAFEGLLYASSPTGRRLAVALYESAEDALPHSPLFDAPLSEAACFCRSNASPKASVTARLGAWFETRPGYSTFGPAGR